MGGSGTVTQEVGSPAAVTKKKVARHLCPAIPLIALGVSETLWQVSKDTSKKVFSTAPPVQGKK